MVSLTVGLLFFTQVSVDGSYVGDLLPGFLLSGSGSASPSCRSRSPRWPESKPAEAGLASGLINTSQQIGGALGIAALSTIATSHTETRGRDRVGAAGGARRRLQCRLHWPARSSRPSASSRR